MQALSRKTPLAGDVDLSVIGVSARLTGFSGADLAALVREACVCSLKESMVGGVSAAGVTPQVSGRNVLSDNVPSAVGMLGGGCVSRAGGFFGLSYCYIRNRRC